MSDRFVGARTTPESHAHLLSRPDFGMGLILVSDLVELGLSVEYRPTTDDPSHAVILGVATKADCDRIASMTAIVTFPVTRDQTA